MLQTFRERSGSLFVKILFGVLVASFALWGVGDIFRSYTAMRPVASVGNSGVSQEEFIQSYQRIISNLQNLAKGKLSPEEIKQMKLYQRVLDDLINMKVIQEQIHTLGIVATDNAVRNHIQAIPNFKNGQGTFDRAKFDALISNAGVSEGAFIREVREGLLQQQLFGSLGAGATLPSFYKDKLYQGLQEQRVFTIATIPLSSIEIKETPEEAALEKIYKENQDAFKQPEYRKLSLLVIDPKTLGSRIQITDAQLNEAYEDRKSNFTLPETRDVTQLIFPSLEKAKEAAAALEAGKTVSDISKLYKPEIRQLNHATRDKFSESHAEPIFKLTAGAATEALDSAFGAAVFVVTKIVPSRMQTFSEVKVKIEEDLKAEQANDQIYELKNKVEDALAGGAKITEVAKEHNLQVHLIEMVDANGLDANQKSVLPKEYRELILDNAFNLVEGADSSVLEARDGTSLIIHVDAITLSMTPELSDIKEKVIKGWKTIKQQEKAAELADEIVREADTQAKLLELAKKHSLTTKVLKPISRTELQQQKEPLDGVPINIIRRGFTLEKGRASYGQTENGFAIIMLQKVVAFDGKKDQAKKDEFNISIKQMLQQDIQHTYVMYLRQHGKVSINEGLLNSLVNHS